MGSAVYLDASAIVKLVVAEPESWALGDRLRGDVEAVTSEVSLTEVPRALRRIGLPPRAIDRCADVLEHMRLLKADRRIFHRAAQMDPPSLRALDAIHLASALSIGDALGAFITYDHQQGTAAALTGLQVETPGVGEPI